MMLKWLKIQEWDDDRENWVESSWVKPGRACGTIIEQDMQATATWTGYMVKFIPKGSVLFTVFNVRRRAIPVNTKWTLLQWPHKSRENLNKVHWITNERLAVGMCGKKSDFATFYSTRVESDSVQTHSLIRSTIVVPAPVAVNSRAPVCQYTRGFQY